VLGEHLLGAEVTVAVSVDDRVVVALGEDVADVARGPRVTARSVEDDRSTAASGA
jgi:hypothetical protein